MSPHRTVPAVLLLCACAAAIPRAATPPPAARASLAVRAHDLGLAHASVFDVIEPRAWEYTTAEPGEKPKLPRAFPGHPPRIPHQIADSLPLTLESNYCVTCHDLAGVAPSPGGPTPIPASHYYDLRNAPTTLRKEITWARYNCVACHLPATDAPPLVENRSARGSE